MGKSIALSNGIYWDASSICYTKSDGTRITDLKTYIDSKFVTNKPFKYRQYRTAAITCSGSSYVETQLTLPSAALATGYTPVIAGWQTVASTDVIAGYFHIYSAYINKNGVLKFYVRNRNSSSRTYYILVTLLFLNNDLLSNS